MGRNSRRPATGAPAPEPEEARLWRQTRACIAAQELHGARAALSALLALRPDSVPAHLMLAAVWLAAGDLRAGAEQTRRAAAMLPDDVHLIHRTAQALARIGETTAARDCLGLPAVADTSSAPALLAIAHVCQGLGLHADALRLMDRARELGLDSPDFRYFRALQLQFNGRLAEAEEEMEACLRAGPTFGRASLSLARMRRQTPASNHVDTIRMRLARAPQGTEDHAALEFALYKELEDLGRTDEAWEALSRGNAVMRSRLDYDPAAEERLFAAIAGAFDPGTAAADPRPAESGPVPIFIVGLPRSGTTLLERILSGHPDIAPAGELTDFPRQLRWTANRHGRSLVDTDLAGALATLDYALLGKRYLEQTQWRARGRRYYIDKLPPNFMLLGAIHRALPRARVLHMVRDPMDVCFSNYRALFGDAYAYSYGIDRIAHHYPLYRRLMKHWHRTMPGVVHDVDYAALVREPGLAACRILEACGIDAAALSSAGPVADAPIATLSSVQAREPVHSRTLGEWRRYAQQLQPLRDALHGSGIEDA